MIAEFFILTLFLCPSNVTKCPPAELLPAKTVRFERFADCKNLGKTLKDLGEYDDYSCHRHEEKEEEGN